MWAKRATLVGKSCQIRFFYEESEIFRDWGQQENCQTSFFRFSSGETGDSGSGAQPGKRGAGG